MVFGLFENKIKIEIDKKDYSEGETIKGKVTLNLKNPVKARALKVWIYSEHYNGKHKKRTMIAEKVLGPEKEYHSFVYPFELMIPTSPFESNTPDILKGIVNFASMFSRMRFFVEAKLDIPMGIDITKRTQINLKMQ